MFPRNSCTPWTGIQPWRHSRDIRGARRSAVIDGRDISPLLRGAVRYGASDPRRRAVAQCRGAAASAVGSAGEWRDVVSRKSTQRLLLSWQPGGVAAVRSGRWKLYLNPALQLYDLENDPGEREPVRNAAIMRKLRGMAILFQEEMQTGTRPAGSVPQRASQGQC